MKKILAVLFLMVLVCGAIFASGSAEQSGETVKPVELANDKWVNQDYSVIKGLEEQVKQTTGYDIKISTSPDASSYQTVIQQSGSSDVAPGLFSWWSGSPLENLVENGYVEDLTQVWADSISSYGVSEDLAKAFTVDGKVYAAPFSILYNVIFYNKNAFSKAGIDNEPQTFNEFLDMCEKLVKAGITPIALKNDGWAGFIWFQQMIAAENPQLYLSLCDGTKSYSDPQVVKAMQRWKNMLDKGYFSKPMALIDWRKKFALGEVAMVLEPTPEITVFKKDFGLVSGIDFGQFSLPSATNNKKVIFFEAAPLCVAKSSASKDTALKILSKWYDKDIQTYLYDNFGFANTSQVIIDDPTFSAVMGNTDDEETYQLILRYYENTPEEIRNSALDEFMKFQMGNVSVETMLNTIEKKATAYWNK